MLSSDASSVREDFLAGSSLRDATARRNAMREPHVAADARAATDGDSTENRRASVDDDVVLDDRMASDPLDGVPALVRHEALRAERDALVKADVLPDGAGLAD